MVFVCIVSGVNGFGGKLHDKSPFVEKAACTFYRKLLA
ncbi:protein of unknown function [Kingella kingae]|nr:protein of unknown function [Kingella kingae]